METGDVSNKKEDQTPGELTFKAFVEPNYVKEQKGVRIDNADLKDGDCVDRGVLGMQVKYRGEMIPLKDYKTIRVVQYAIKTS